MANDKLTAAREFFAKDMFATEAAGIEIIEVGENVRCQMTLAEVHRNAVGGVMGGALFTLADFTFAVASNFEQPPTVTLNAHISYISAPRGKTLVSLAKIIKTGKRAVFIEVEIKDELGNLIAAVDFTGMRA
ncbi:MAG: PaaI family thioesterase [Oscillospiraceae bacterium]|jgi:acyl-CoA thioesterase|nr:PaaI family thioesterase [Oscillospiraceae bacterium]